jgi:hypothetical protein
MTPPLLRVHRDADTRLVSVSCGDCGTLLAIGEVELNAVMLAAENATARPCCPSWDVAR